MAENFELNGNTDGSGRQWDAHNRVWINVAKPNFGAPPAGYIPWEPTEAEAAEIRAGGRITPAGRWDSATPEQRKLINPALNPHKHWFEQPENQ